MIIGRALGMGLLFLKFTQTEPLTPFASLFSMTMFKRALPSPKVRKWKNKKKKKKKMKLIAVL